MARIVKPPIQLEPEDLPAPMFAQRDRLVVTLPPQLIAQIDAFIEERKDSEPEICEYRNRLIEVALKFFLRSFDLLIGE